MTRSAEDRLRDILDAIQAVDSYMAVTEDRSDRLVVDALKFRFTVIGEAANALDRTEIERREPDIPWGAIIGLRNLVAHEYFRLDPEVMLEVVDSGQLSELAAACRRLLSD